MKKIFMLLFIIACWSCDNDKESRVILPGVSFSEFMDPRDMKVYKCVTIGEQTWMAENLAYRIPQGSVCGCYTYGEEGIDTSRVEVSVELFKIAVNEAKERGLLDETYDGGMWGIQHAKILIDNCYTSKETGKEVVDLFKSWYGENLPGSVLVLEEILSSLKPDAIIETAKKRYLEAEYRNGGYADENGLLYTFKAAQQAVPDGWRLPTDDDWKKLEETLGMPFSEIEKLDLWRGRGEGLLLRLDGGCGFDVLFSGARLWGSWPQGTPYRDKGNKGYFWTSSLHVENDTTNYGITRIFSVNKNQILRGTSMPEAAYSVRLIKE